MAKVVTYQAPGGAKIRLCREHEAAHKVAGTWPRDGHGEEYCRVSHGAHHGGCDECEREGGDTIRAAEARIHEMDRALAPGSETAMLGDAIRQVRDAADPAAELAWWVGAYARYAWLEERHARDGEEWSVEEEIYTGEDWTGWTPPPPTPAELRAWRTTEGLTQERAGKLAGVERLAWARWELGTRPVPQWLRDTLMQRWGSAPGTAACTHPRHEPASGLPPGAWTCPDCGAVGMPRVP